MTPTVVAAVQAAPVLLDREATIGKVVTLAGKAAADGARLVAFPEAFVPGYPDWVWRTRPWDADATALYARLLDQAVVVGSAATDVLADTARRLGIWLSVGVDERDVPGFREMSAVLARRIPGAAYRVVAGAGHMVSMEQPEAVRELLIQFAGERASWSR